MVTADPVDGLLAHPLTPRNTISMTTTTNEITPPGLAPEIPRVEGLLTNAQLGEKLLTLLINNDIKEGSKKALLLEYGFLQGLFVANPEYAKHAYLVICMSCGRSILD